MITQREMAQILGFSLGIVNKYLALSVEKGYIRKEGKALYLTEAGQSFLSPFRVDAALILAAGFGQRFVPLTYETPKGLLKVFGERMIERQIRQLQEAGISDITIVVGYLKEKFDYLIDQFGVRLLYNPEFSTKNTLATLYHSRHLLYDRNVYVLSSDNWLRRNPYETYEGTSWYSLSYMEGETSEWCVDFDKKGLFKEIRIGGRDSYAMYGPVYMDRNFSARFLPVLETYYQRPGTENFYWEQVLADMVNSGKKDIAMYAFPQPADTVYEFENLAELRAFDEYYNHTSDNKAMALIAEIFRIEEKAIENLRCLKAGMTNKSFIFSIGPDSYICRIPGEGTSHLINRREEYASYRAIEGKGLCEDVIYINPDTGYKISRFYEGTRNADPDSAEDVKACMALLHRFHDMELSVSHEFNIRERMAYYESLCMEHGGIPFEDYLTVKSKMIGLLDYLDGLGRKKILTHIDSVADNFLFIPHPDSKGSKEEIRLIDWEYSGMADPLLDIAMHAIYSFYDEKQTEELMEYYFLRPPLPEERKIIHSFMALGGFLWALWAVYKAYLGEDYDDYTLKMYRYAKTFSR